MKVIEVYENTYLTSDGKLRKKIYGVGINDADYVVDVKSELPAINGKRKRKQKFLCRTYTVWRSIIKRCYGASHPNYENVKMHEDWFYFSNFKKWYESQDNKNKEVDKDLLYYQNKLYSADNCVLVDKEVNQFLVTRERSRGKYPLGVSLDKRSGLFRARSAGNILIGKSEWIGNFKTTEEAHIAWQKSKIEIAKWLYNKQTNPLVKKGLLRVINKLEYELCNKILTEDL